MTPPIKRTAKNKKKFESFGERTKRKAAADKKFEESITAGEKNRSALKQLKRVFPQGLGNLVLGAGQSLVDKEGGKKRMKKGARSLDTASATSQRMDIKEERARKEHNEKFGVKRLNKGGKVRKMQQGGEIDSLSDADRVILQALLQGQNKMPSRLGGESGRTISGADRARIGALVGRGSGIRKSPSSSISDADRQRIMDAMAMGMEDGGAVPKKFKGFSKLHEDVQQKMNPAAAAKYEDGGEVRGMGRAYMGAPRKAKIR